MKAMQCELCGGTNIIKDGDFFVCQSCGMKYTVESAKKMMIEGVVQVEGEVSIKNDTAIRNNLELAQSALTAANFEKAEKYADDVIALDQQNVDAWFIKAKSALGQTSIANDRVFEMMVCCKSVIDIVKDRVRADPPIATPHELGLLGEVSNLVIKGVTGLCALYGDAFTPYSNSKFGGMIINSLPTTLETATKTLELLKACFQGDENLRRFTKVFQDNGEDESDARTLWEMLNNDTICIGSARLQCAEIINTSVVKAWKEENARFEKNRVFTYYVYGGPAPDTSDENTYLTNHQTTLKNYMTIIDAAIDLCTDESVFRYVSSSQSDKTWFSYLEVYFGNKKVFIDALKTHTTMQRVVSQYSSGNKLSVGYAPTESFIESLDKEIAVIEATKAVSEQLGSLWGEKIAQEERKRVEAWWKEHGNLKESLTRYRRDVAAELTSVQAELNALEKQMGHVEQENKSDHPVAEDVKRLTSEVDNLNEKIGNLGFFKRKERAALEKERSERQDSLSRATQQLEIELNDERNRIQAALEPFKTQKDGLETQIAKLQHTIASADELLSKIPDQNIIDQLVNGDVAAIFSEKEIS